MVYSLKYVNTYNAYIRKIEPKYIGTEYLLLSHYQGIFIWISAILINYTNIFYFTLLFWIMISFIFYSLLFINLELNFLWRQRVVFADVFSLCVSSLRRPFFRLLWWRCCWPHVLHVIRFHQIVGCEYVGEQNGGTRKDKSGVVGGECDFNERVGPSTPRRQRGSPLNSTCRGTLFILYRLKYASMYNIHHQ
jgi:hypothetical protein